MVFYYTGTGNSRYIAEMISKVTEEPLYFINDDIKNNRYGAVSTKGRVILVTPTYAWRIPRIVRDWLIRTEFSNAEKIWFVMDCGSEIGNAAKYNKQLAEQKNLRYMGTAQIIMPENYIAMFSSPSEEKARAIIKKSQPYIHDAAETIRSDREFPAPRCSVSDRIMSGPVNMVFYPFFVKANAFKASDACTGCGKCAGLCPMNNIAIREKKPVWGRNCTHCMACISYCPTEAIEYGKHSVGQRRYHI